MNERECPLCQDRRGKRWTEALMKGTKSIREAQLALGMTKEDIEEHLYKHNPKWDVQTAVTETSDREFYIKRLAQMGEDLHEMLEDVVDFGTTNPETIKSATTLTREIRETLRLLGEITKVLKDEESQSMMLQIEEMKRNYMNFSAVVVTLACADCKSKIINALEQQKLMLKK